MPVKMNKTPVKSNHVWEDLFAGADRVCVCVYVYLGVCGCVGVVLSLHRML